MQKDSSYFKYPRILIRNSSESAFIVCGRIEDKVEPFKEVIFRCPHPGVKGNEIVFKGSVNEIAFLEIEVFDCPNGFFHLNNKCLKWLMPDTLVNQHKKCDVFRGKLIELATKEDLDLALKVMSDFNHDEIFISDYQPSQNVLLDDENLIEEVYKIESKIHTFLKDFGLILRKVKDTKKSKILPIYGSPDLKRPSICLFGKYHILASKNDSLLQYVFLFCRGRNCFHKLGHIAK